MKQRIIIGALTLGASAALAVPAGAQAPPVPPPPGPPQPPQPAPTPQRVVIAGVPSSCVRSNFIVRVSIQPPTVPGARVAPVARA